MFERAEYEEDAAFLKDPKGERRRRRFFFPFFVGRNLFFKASFFSSFFFAFFGSGRRHPSLLKRFFLLLFGLFFHFVTFSLTFVREKREKNTRARIRAREEEEDEDARGFFSSTDNKKKMATTPRRRAFLLLFCVVGLVSSSSTRTRSSFLVEGAKTKRLSLSETDFGAILISEIMYNPTKRGEAKEMGDAGRTYGEASGEWVEFLNPSVTNVVDVSGWYFSDEKNLPDDDDDKDSSSAMFQFPLNTKMQPQERIVVAKNVTKFQISYGNDTNTTASINVIKDDELPFKLSNKGEKLLLLNAKKEIVHEVEYDDKAPWPIIFAGYSIELTSAKSDATDPYSWVSSLIFGGTPGRASRSFMDDD